VGSEKVPAGGRAHVRIVFGDERHTESAGGIPSFPDQGCSSAIRVSPDGLEAFARGRRTSIICVEGLDLAQILCGRLDLVEVIERKKRRRNWQRLCSGQRAFRIGYLGRVNAIDL